jgi:aminoglycoside phosphotransferase (APT) family kinase protein
MAPAHASSATAHDVIREYRILDALRNTPVPIAQPVVACDDPAVFGGPFYVMDRVDGQPIRSKVPDGWAQHPDTHGQALEQLIDALAQVHLVDWQGCGLGSMAPKPGREGVRTDRWLQQLASYRGRSLPEVSDISEWLDTHRPPTQKPALCHGDYKLDNVLFAEEAPPRLLAIVDWEMASIGDPLVDLAWALIFHPGAEGTMPLGRTGRPAFAVEGLPSRDQLVDRWASATGRDASHLIWYEVFARWKLAIVLEGSYAKFTRGESENPMHQHFGSQVDLLVSSAATMITQMVDS